MKKRLLGVILFIFCAASQAGITIGGTRFVYEERNPFLSISLGNSDANSYLVKTQIVQPDAIAGAVRADSVPFVATPPLFVLAGGKQNKLRLVSDGGALPEDKETLFELVVTAIPSSDKRPSVNSVQVAMRSHIKLVYRPASLKGDPEKAYKLLHWIRVGNKVTVKNPTAFYVTLLDVEVNGAAVKNPGVVAPYSERELTVCEGQGKCIIQWKSINDFGRILPPETRSV